MKGINEAIESRKWLAWAYLLYPAIGVIGGNLITGAIANSRYRASNTQSVILGVTLVLALVVQVLLLVSRSAKMKENPSAGTLLGKIEFYAIAALFLLSPIIAVAYSGFFTFLIGTIFLAYALFAGGLRLFNVIAARDFEAFVAKAKDVTKAPKVKKDKDSAGSSTLSTDAPGYPRLAIFILAGLFLVSMVFPWYGSQASISATGMDTISSKTAINGFMTIWPVFSLLGILVVALLSISKKASIARIIIAGVSLAFGLAPAFIRSSTSSSVSFEGIGSSSGSSSAGPLWGLFFGCAMILAIIVFSILDLKFKRKIAGESDE